MAGGPWTRLNPICSGRRERKMPSTKSSCKASEDQAGDWRQAEEGGGAREKGDVRAVRIKESIMSLFIKRSRDVESLSGHFGNNGQGDGSSSEKMPTDTLQIRRDSQRFGSGTRSWGEQGHPRRRVAFWCYESPTITPCLAVSAREGPFIPDDDHQDVLPVSIIGKLSLGN